jgi:hypothetical protein
MGVFGCLLLIGVVLPWINRPQRLFGVFVLLGAAYESYRLLFTAFQVRVFATSKIEFISVCKTWRTSAYGLRSIAAPLSRGNYYLSVQHPEGKIRLFNRVNGLQGFLKKLKSINQAVEVEGVRLHQSEL